MGLKNLLGTKIAKPPIKDVNNEIPDNSLPLIHLDVMTADTYKLVMKRFMVNNKFKKIEDDFFKIFGDEYNIYSDEYKRLFKKFQGIQDFDDLDTKLLDILTETSVKNTHEENMEIVLGIPYKLIDHFFEAMEYFLFLSYQATNEIMLSQYNFWDNVSRSKLNGTFDYQSLYDVILKYDEILVPNYFFIQQKIVFHLNLWKTGQNKQAKEISKSLNNLIYVIDRDHDARIYWFTKTFYMMNTFASDLVSMLKLKENTMAYCKDVGRQEIFYIDNLVYFYQVPFDNDEYPELGFKKGFQRCSKRFKKLRKKLKISLEIALKIQSYDKSNKFYNYVINNAMHSLKICNKKAKFLENEAKHLRKD